MLEGAVAEWSKALLVREKNEIQKSQVRPRTWAPLKKIRISTMQNPEREEENVQLQVKFEPKLY